MYEFLPHTADVRIRVEAECLEEFFRDALLALGDVAGALDRGAEQNG
jgi:SHS2 domain-containing protein